MDENNCIKLETAELHTKSCQTVLSVLYTHWKQVC